MDYGHPIRFGTFITPGAGSPQRAVQLAQRSEWLGFDLATFQVLIHEDRMTTGDLSRVLDVVDKVGFGLDNLHGPAAKDV